VVHNLSKLLITNTVLQTDGLNCRKAICWHKCKTTKLRNVDTRCHNNRKAWLRHRGFAEFELGFMSTLRQEFESLIQ